MRKSKPRTSKKTQKKNKDYYFDRAAGQRVIKFIETFCRHSKGKFAGQTIKLEKWQKEIIMQGFGWKRTADNLRKYRTIYVEVPKKNGKSTLAAPLALYLTCVDKEPGAEVYAAAGDKAQAGIVFNLAKTMVENDSNLSASLDTFRDSIFHGKSMSTFKVVSAEAYTKEGVNTHGLVFDEMHVQPNSELYDCFVTSTIGREQPMTIIITTAGVRGTFGHEIHLYAKQVKDGLLKDETYLPYIFAADEKDDPYSEKTWKKANPMYGISIPKVNMQDIANRAKNQPTFYNSFLRYHLNIWTGATTSFINHQTWDKCNYAPVELQKLKGRKCNGGMDLASVSDMTALVFYFPNPDGPDDIYCKFYCPADTILEKKKKENNSYELWVKEGWLTTTPGNVLDYAYVERDIKKIAEVVTIESIGFDRWASTDLVGRLTDDGFMMSRFGQGYASMSTPTKAIERRALVKDPNESLNHGGNPILAWMIDNTQVESDAAGNIKPAKNKSTGKIDGVVALAMAIGENITRANDNPKPKQSKYNDPNINLITIGTSKQKQ